MSHLYCVYRPPFGAVEPRIQTFPDARLTLHEIVDRMELPSAFRRYGTICIGGEEVPRAVWHLVRPKASVNGFPNPITFHAPILGGGEDGGKNPLAVLGALAITVLSGGAAGGLFATAGGLFTKNSISALFLAGGISLVGSLLLNALVPPPTLDSSGGDARESRRDASARGNLLEPNAPAPRVLGTRRMFPPLLAEPLVTFDGEDEIVEAVYGLAGPHSLEDIRIGATSVSSVPGLEIETREGWPGDARISLLRRYGRTEQVGQELRGHQVSADNAALLEQSIDVSLALPQPQVVATRQSPDQHELHITFPQGLGRPSAPESPLRVPFRLRARLRGTDEWRNLPEIHYRGVEFRPLRVTIRLSWRDAGGVAPTAASSKGFVAAFYETPDQTTAPASTGWQADSYFYDGSGLTYVNQNVLGSTGVLNCRLDRHVAEFFLDPSEWAPGVWEIEVTRGLAISAALFTDSTYTYDGVVYDLFRYFGTPPRVPFARADMTDTAALQRSVSIWNSAPVQTDEFAVIAIRARNQNIERLSVKAGGYVRDWNGSTWDTWTVASNPAPHYYDVLTGALNKNPLPTANVDSAGLVTWRAACTTNSYECNAVVDDVSVEEALRVLAGCGYARPYQSDRWGVIQDYDRSEEPPQQIFTPRNSANFRWAKAFALLPDGLRVVYDDASRDYETQHVTVFRSGLVRSQGLIEQVRYEGVTTEAEAIARAQYDLAQLEKRATLFTIDVSHDALTCRRGALVGLVHDAVARSGGFGRVVGGGTEQIELDAAVECAQQGFIFELDDVFSSSVTDVFATGLTTKASIRYPDGTIVQVEVTNATGSHSVLTFSESVDYVPIGSLVATHLLTQDFRRVIVKDITMKSEYDATLTLVDEAPEIFA